MKSRTFSRRAILRGVGATVALPLLDVIPAFAQSPLMPDAGKTDWRIFIFPMEFREVFGTRKKRVRVAS